MVFLGHSQVQEKTVKANHRVWVVRISEVLKHPNAERLEIYPIPGTGYQYVGSIGQFKVGDLAVYIQPDSVVPFTQGAPWDFLWADLDLRAGEEAPIRKRRIKAKKIRKEWSEGLLIPVDNIYVSDG